MTANLAQSEIDKALDHIYDYIVKSVETQGRLLSFKDLYGDGTIWMPFSRKGAEEIYNTIASTWQENLSKEG